MFCPLCQSPSPAPYLRDDRREYLSCAVCKLVFVPSDYMLSAEAERAEYMLHQNHVDDPGYRRFLSRLAKPLLQCLPPARAGLDFGCGPGPALAAMLREAGHDVALYDPFFAPDASALTRQYDFITATEVVEHLRHPGAELSALWSMLRRGGWLGVMTKLVIDRAAFAGWHYKNDPTHICFFSRDTWRWWARRNNASLSFIGSDVILLQRAL